jgi:hypothetical protein
MKQMFRIALLCAAFFTVAHAQDFTFSGQLRERSEFDTKLLTPGQTSDVFHLLRTRLRADVVMNPSVSVRMEIQDARTYGQKGTLLNNGSPAFDLRQGYVEVKNLFDSPLGFRLGRQELGYGSQRLIGPSDWGNFSQTFDAGLLRGSFGDVTLDLFGAAVARNVNPPLGYTRDVFLTGAWLTWKPADATSTLHGFFLFDNPRGSSTRQNRFTAGINAAGAYGGFDYALDGAYQFGDYITARSTLDIGAFMACAKAGYTLQDLSHLRIGAGANFLSGSDLTDSTKYGTFNTLYPTQHAKYGHMDYFTNIPAVTSEMGLQDVFAELSLKPSQNFGVFIEAHLFSTMQDPKDVLPANAVTTKSIGTELDVWCAWKVAGAVNMQAGYSVFDFHSDRYILHGRKTTNWAYLQTTVNI